MEELHYRPDRKPLVSPGGTDCQVRDMTATVSADVTLAALQAQLAAHDQWLPIDGDATQTLGTLVSCDSTGPLRLGYGAWRDLLLGVQFTNGRGELITAGGRTVKNVAGYDLTKFMVGQRGVFGKLLTITTRTYRKPAGAMLARYAPDARIVSRLIPTSLRPHWAVLTAEALFCGYLADEPGLAFYRTAVSQSEPAESLQRSLEDDVRDRARLWNFDAEHVFRASVPPAGLNDLAPKLSGTAWSADAAFGVLVGAIESEPQADAIRRAVLDAGGTFKRFRGPFGPAVELSTTPAERQIIERLKHAFDPDRTLNPLPWQTA
ncbi:MAG TPA: FAD-binding oxidoreductase [Tepidisphaeraceae bacterium]|nr:FAD-binding oxidoreductase [Tepidisphaeraceae bacterium]